MRAGGGGPGAGADLRLLLADDEAPARRRLRRLVESLDGVAVVAVAEDGRRALDLAAATEPDVALLDVRMPGLDGLQVARRLPAGTAVIFITAHSDFAVDAFEAEAVDYLLKPVAKQRLARALERVRQRRAEDPAAGHAERLARLIDRLAARLEGASPGAGGRAAAGLDPAGPAPVLARRGGSTYYFDPRSVDHFTARAKYVELTFEGDTYSTDESLTALAERLAPWGFFRAHRGALVRLAAVRALHTGDSGPEVELAGGHRLPVGRRRLAGLRRALAG